MAKKLGFKVICHSYNLEYFEPVDAKLPLEGFIKKVRTLIKKERRVLKKRMLKQF